MADEIPFSAVETDIDLTEAIKKDSLNTCQNCGRELEYSGRGRHPTVCKRGEGCREEEPRLTASRSRSGDVERIRTGFQELYVAIGVGVSFVDGYDGMVIGGNAAKLADSWAKLAENDPKVRKALMKMLAGTSWSGVIFAHAMVAVPIMQHHNMVPGAHEREPSPSE